MTPHASREPACPVDRLSVNPPRPRSSVSACTTTARPSMLWAPTNEMSESWYVNCATPVLSAWMLPKSPACLISSLGPPCLFCDKHLKKLLNMYVLENDTYGYNNALAALTISSAL